MPEYGVKSWILDPGSEPTSLFPHLALSNSTGSLSEHVCRYPGLCVPRSIGTPHKQSCLLSTTWIYKYKPETWYIPKEMDWEEAQAQPGSRSGAMWQGIGESHIPRTWSRRLWSRYWLWETCPISLMDSLSHEKEKGQNRACWGVRPTSEDSQPESKCKTELTEKE